MKRIRNVSLGLLVIALSGVQPAHAQGTAKPNILILATGGTIAGAGQPARSPDTRRAPSRSTR